MNDVSTDNLELYGTLSSELARAGLADTARVLTLADFPSQFTDRVPFDGLVIYRPTRRWIGDANFLSTPFEIQDLSLGHDWYAEAEGYRRIGLWMFHLLFSGKQFGGLELRHEQSRITNLWVSVEQKRPDDGFLKFDTVPQPVSYKYYPAECVRHPFAKHDRPHLNECDLPMFRFGWSDQTLRYQGNPDTADEIILSLTAHGLAEFATLLLDFALPGSELNEINIEPPFVGIAGTRPLSLEARLWLPGSFGFYCNSLSELVLSPS